MKRGFTLIEGLIVVAVLGIILAMAIPSCNNGPYHSFCKKCYEEGMVYYVDAPIYETCASYKIEKKETHVLLKLYDARGKLKQESMISPSVNYTIIRISTWDRCKKYFKRFKEKEERDVYNRRRIR